MNLEDIFISIVDTTSAPAAGARKRPERGYRSVEKTIASSIIQKTAAKSEESSQKEDE